MQTVTLTGTITIIESIVPSKSKIGKFQGHQNFWMLQDGSDNGKGNRFSLINDQIEQLIGLLPGDHVKVKFRIVTTEHKGTVFNNLHTKSIIKL